MSLRDLLELAALLLLVAAVALATKAIWPTLLAAAVVLAYLSHAWAWGETQVGRRKDSDGDGVS